MKKILVSATNYQQYCSSGMKMLEDYGCEITATTKGRPYTPEELKELVGDMDGVIVGVDTWNEEIFRCAPRLKAMARFGIGVDNIDLKAARSHGIKVSNCRGINSNAVAEHTVMLMLSMIRLLPRLDRTTREGAWERVVVHEVNHYKIGFIGFGGIAKKTAQKLVPFGAKLMAYDVYPDKQAAQSMGVRLVDMDTLLKESDIISLHVPYVPETYHMINHDTIKKMKTGVMLVNTARGALVDEEAAYTAMKNGMIGAFASDVFEKDPVDVDNPLLSLDRFICTPHTAAESYENYDLTSIETAQALIDVFEGKEPKNALN